MRRQIKHPTKEKELFNVLVHLSGLEKKFQRQNIETEPGLKSDYLIWV